MFYKKINEFCSKEKGGQETEEGPENEAQVVGVFAGWDQAGGGMAPA